MPRVPQVFCDNHLDGGYHVPEAHWDLAGRLHTSSYKSVFRETVSTQTVRRATLAATKTPPPRLTGEPCSIVCTSAFETDFDDTSIVELQPIGSFIVIDWQSAFLLDWPPNRSQRPPAAVYTDTTTPFFV